MPREIASLRKCRLALIIVVNFVVAPAVAVAPRLGPEQRAEGRRVAADPVQQHRLQQLHAPQVREVQSEHALVAVHQVHRVEHRPLLEERLHAAFVAHAPDDETAEESAYELLQRGHALLRDRHHAQAAIVQPRTVALNV